MPFLISILRFVATNALGWIFTALGLAFVTYSAIDYGMNTSIDLIDSSFADLNPTAYQILSLLKIPHAVSLWVSGNLAGMTVAVSKLFLAKRT